MVFIEELNRRGEAVHRFVLMCTDLRFAPLDVLRVYKLRWYIEVRYRECKQNHGLGQFHAVRLKPKKEIVRVPDSKTCWWRPRNDV